MTPKKIERRPGCCAASVAAAMSACTAWALRHRRSQSDHCGNPLAWSAQPAPPSPLSCAKLRSGLGAPARIAGAAGAPRRGAPNSGRRRRGRRSRRRSRLSTRPTASHATTARASRGRRRRAAVAARRAWQQRSAGRCRGCRPREPGRSRRNCAWPPRCARPGGSGSVRASRSDRPRAARQRPPHRRRRGARAKAGDLARADQHQADGAVAAAEAAVAQAEAGLAAARQHLRALAGAGTCLVRPRARHRARAPGSRRRATASPCRAAGTEGPCRRRRAFRRTWPATQSRANPELTLATTRDRGARGEASQQTITLAVRIPFGAGPRFDARAPMRAPRPPRSRPSWPWNVSGSVQNAKRRACGSRPRSPAGRRRAPRAAGPRVARLLRQVVPTRRDRSADTPAHRGRSRRGRAPGCAHPHRTRRGDLCLAPGPGPAAAVTPPTLPSNPSGIPP
jgi:hypothetical protein